MTIRPAFVDDAALRLDAKNIQALGDLIQEYPDEAQLTMAAIEDVFTNGPIQVVHPDFDDAALIAKAKEMQDLAILIKDYTAHAKLLLERVELGVPLGQPLITTNTSPIVITMDERGRLHAPNGDISATRQQTPGDG